LTIRNWRWQCLLIWSLPISSRESGGIAILSGILNEQADEVIAHYAQVGINLIHREEIVDWTTLTLKKKT